MASELIFDSLEEAVREIFGNKTEIVDRRGISGGDINDAYLLVLSDGRKVFLKENRGNDPGFFAAETEGLNALREAGAIRVPAPMACGNAGGTAFLMMEYLEPGMKKRSFWEDFGHGLAKLHSAGTTAFSGDGKYGFNNDNYIGGSVQINSPRNSWISFFAECRLLPQFKMAADRLPSETAGRLDRLIAHLDEYLIEPEAPSLLHGDLWGGNFICGPDGDTALIDPAVYVGCAEADIAMTELFGGFSESFYGAYRESGLIKPGYHERRNIYNLYHMLNHLNLFGGSYLGAVQRMIPG